MTIYEEMIRNVRMYIGSPPSLKLGVNRFPPYKKEEKLFQRLLTNPEGTFAMEIYVDEDTKMLRYKLSFLYNEIGKIEDRCKMADYLIKSNSENESDLCFAGIDDNNDIFVEIRHNFELFPIDYKQIREFEDICIKRLKYEAENIKKLFG